MKKAFAALLLLCCISCKKEVRPNVFGEYVGDVEVSVNNTRQPVLNNHTISVHPCTAADQVTLDGNLIMTATVHLSGMKFTIPETKVSGGSGLEVVEYGQGSFDNNRLTFELYQKLQDNGVVKRLSSWKGTLAKK